MIHTVDLPSVDVCASAPGTPAQSVCPGGIVARPGRGRPEMAPNSNQTDCESGAIPSYCLDHGGRPSRRGDAVWSGRGMVMRILSPFGRLVAAVALSGLCATAAHALDPKSQTNAVPLPADAFKSTKEAFRAGIQDYNAGDKVGAVRALEYAAQQGHALARWKLGRMYADGDGVPQDDLRAFEHFSRICDEHADEPTDSPNARFVASAFVSLGSYYLDGIQGTYVKQNGERARDMFQYAAAYFGDSDAQYNLARLQLDGVGGPKDGRQAVRWLNLAAEKGHPASQALLGHMLFNGEGVARQRPRGLMWLTLARDAALANPKRDGWIIDLHDKAQAEADKNDREMALVYIDRMAPRTPRR
jgi:TPR repeat protein